MTNYIKTRHVGNGAIVVSRPDGSVVHHGRPIDDYAGKRTVIRKPRPSK
jgi:hypothetical protein